VIWMRAVATATSGMTEVVEATDQAVGVAVAQLAAVTGTAVLAAIEREYGIDRGPETETAAATETTTIIVLGAIGPLAHPYADVLAAAHARARAVVLVTEDGHDLDLLDGDLGLGVVRLLLL
jgi:hypothetical protein